MSGMPLFVGVDGGGTRTVAVVGRGSPIVPSDDGDVVLGRGEAGPSNPQVVGFENAAAVIAAAIVAAMASVGGKSAAFERATLGIAGASRSADQLRLQALVADRLGVDATSVDLIADVGLILPAAGFVSGVALVAGTGSSAFGVAPDGRSAIAGGWGYLIGDDGSAFDVGREALRAVLRADGGLGPSTELTTALARTLGVSQPRDLIRVIYQAQAPRATVATLAPLVVEVARADDTIARQILTRAGQELGKLARAVARRLGLGSEAAVVATGRMLAAGDLILDPLREDLARGGLSDLRLLEREPVIGALRRASGVRVLVSRG
jgi:N-acetylglucosamine kinase-like BadF-type ATPase